MKGRELFALARELGKANEVKPMREVAAEHGLTRGQVSVYLLVERRIAPEVQLRLANLDLPRQELLNLAGFWIGETEEPNTAHQLEYLDALLKRTNGRGRVRHGPNARRAKTMRERFLYLRRTLTVADASSLPIVTEVLDYLDGVERRYLYLKVKK